MYFDQAIKEGIELAKGIASEANRLINAAFKNFADRTIFIGLICLKLKVLIRGDKKPWAVWAEENMPFILKEESREIHAPGEQARLLLFQLSWCRQIGNAVFRHQRDEGN